jgi:gamma-glutamyl phosphate reductase
MPDKQHVLGSISVSGLKLEFEDAPSGIVRIYFEAFPEFISLGTNMHLKTVLNDGLLENVISSSYEVSKLFLKRIDQAYK